MSEHFQTTNARARNRSVQMLLFFVGKGSSHGVDCTNWRRGWPDTMGNVDTLTRHGPWFIDESRCNWWCNRRRSVRWLDVIGAVVVTTVWCNVGSIVDESVVSVGDIVGNSKGLRDGALVGSYVGCCCCLLVQWTIDVTAITTTTIPRRTIHTIRHPTDNDHGKGGDKFILPLTAILFVQVVVTRVTQCTLKRKHRHEYNVVVKCFSYYYH